jgi:hypothetical protein
MEESKNESGVSKLSHEWGNEITNFANGIDQLFNVSLKLYSKAKLFGYLTILGGVLALFIPFLILTGRGNTFRIVSLSALSGVIIIIGSLVYCYLNYMDYKNYLVREAYVEKQMDLIKNKQDNEFKLLMKDKDNSDNYVNRPNPNDKMPKPAEPPKPRK